MNRPCRIHFHEDAAPLYEQLPERYKKNVEYYSVQGLQVLTLLVQNAFPVDFAPEIIRTRVGGTHTEDPVDFPLASLSMIEWFYGSEVPEPLYPQPHVPREPRTDHLNQSRGT